jgi:general secretion pathway protein D
MVTLLQNFGNTKIISSPKICAINGQEAKILIGTREAYVTSSQSQATSTTVTSENVSFIDVGVKLNILPIINDDGYVTMKIKPEISSVSSTLTTPLGSQIPIVDTSEAETSVKVKDGTMIVIAGLRKYDKRSSSSGIPILGKIPILDLVFGSKAGLNEVTELIIFITPHIIKGDTNVPNMELEKTFPPDVATSVVQEKVMDRIMMKENIVIGKPQAEQLKDSAEISSKIKGLKEY